MTTVAAHATFTIDAGTTVGEVAVSIAAASLPRGRYRLDAYTQLRAATTPAADDVLAISVGGSAIARLITGNTVQDSGAFTSRPITVWADLDGASSVAITAAVAETTTNTQTFALVLAATRIPYGAAA